MGGSEIFSLKRVSGSCLFVEKFCFLAVSDDGLCISFLRI